MHSSANHVLRIHELVEYIIRFTYCEENSKQPCVHTRQTLAALARVNRLFSSIALPHIWRFLDSATPLAQLLPSDLDKFVKPAMAAKRMLKELGVRSAKPGDFERYRFYASFVRTINLSGDDFRVCEALEKADHWLLTLGLNDGHYAKLERMQISAFRFDNFTCYLKTRARPTVHSLTLILNQGARCHSALEDLGESFQNLRHLSIVQVSLRLLDLGLGQALEGSHKLNSLTLHIEANALPVLLRRVRNLPHISRLALSVFGKVPRLIRSTNSKPQGQKIVALEWVGHYATLPFLLALLNEQKITCIDFVCTTTPYMPINLMGDFLRCLQTNHLGVRKVYLRDKAQLVQPFVDRLLQANQDARVMCTVPSNTLSLIGSLTYLRTLNLAVCGASITTPQVLDTISRQLHHLEVCIFSPYRITNDAGHVEWPISIIHVTDFVFACHNLCSLSLCFDARRPVEIVEDIQPRLPAQKPKHFSLGVASSAIDNVEYVTTHLRSMPLILRFSIQNMAGIHTSLIRTTEEEEMWESVYRQCTATKTTPHTPLAIE